MFYNLELFNRAFRDYDMGIASAMAWFLFLGTLAATRCSSVFWANTYTTKGSGHESPVARPTP